MVYFRLAVDGRMEGDGNLKLMIYSLERAIRLMPRNSWQYTIVLDCQGKTLRTEGLQSLSNRWCDVGYVALATVASVGAF